MSANENRIEIYQTADGQTEIQVRLDADTVWLNRQQLAALFGRDIKTVGKHIGNVFKEGELSQSSVVANFATTAADGKTYQVSSACGMDADFLTSSDCWLLSAYELLIFVIAILRAMECHCRHDGYCSPARAVIHNKPITFFYRRALTSHRSDAHSLD